VKQPLSCSACGLWISEKDDRCPHCDRPIDNVHTRWRHLPEYILSEIIAGLLLIMASYFEPRNPPTKWIIPDSFSWQNGAARLPANNLLNAPPWPLAPFPTAADIEANEFAAHPQK
jgi:hypothetical protein